MTPHTLNPLTLPLAGTSLIEASAGTGKTYNIAALFARLVLVEHMPVERILVVTFTKAATAELKTRLRTRLAEALAYLRQEPGAEAGTDAVLLAIIHAAQQQESDARLILRLQAALNQFDGAAIHTIHGFCQRVLTDYAFLCNTPFDTETAEADPALLLTLAQDFWRSHISHHPLYAPLAAARGLTPQQWLSELGSWLSRSDIVFRLPENHDLAQAQQHLAACWQTLCRQAETIENLFWPLKAAKLNGTSFQDRTFQPFFSELLAAVAADNPDYPFSKADKFACFHADFLHAKTKKNQQLSEAEVAALAPLADFGAALAELAAAENSTVLQWQYQAFVHIRQQLHSHKQNSRQRSFDDLLANVAAALGNGNPQAAALAQALAANWHIALIDEFQDTDPLQYAIFKTAFADQGRPLLMVGDPKQAIYRFRGADIHAYLQAAADTPPARRHTLQTNYRSHRTLVNGIGHLFSGKQRPFVLDGIPYTAVAAERADSQLAPAAAAIHIRWLHEHTDLDTGGKETLPNKDQLRQRAANWCADEIAAAIGQGLSGSLKLKQQPLQAGDIAVLVETHNQGEMVAAALKQRGVQSVSLGNHSVFATEEALAMAALLAFWLHPQQTATLRFVLAGPLFCRSGAELQTLNSNEAALSQWISRAETAREHWQQHGIYAALQQFSRHSNLETGLLQRRQERSLTNFWQLGELLAAAETDSPAPAALQQWLQHQIGNTSQQQGEAQQLRLESDDALVKIVTMHAAKGLEYPLVYCPFVWDGKDQQRRNWALLHRDNQHELVHQTLLGEEDSHTIVNDHMGELLRLYYVALTRAREQLVLYAAACRNTADNPFGYLLAGSPESSVADTRALWHNGYKNSPVSSLKALWQQCLTAAPADSAFAWHEGAPAPAQIAPAAAPATPYQALRLPERPFQYIRHTSFTALSRHSHGSHSQDSEAQTPQLDAAETATAPAAEQTPETAILGFARGMNAGVCLHALLENTDFARPAAEQQALYAPLLAQYGFADTPVDSLLPMVDTVRHAPLWPGSSLADIPATQRLPEMGFVLHMHDFALPRLRHWFAQPHIGLPAACVQAAARLDFATVNGFLNGFIDMSCQDRQGRVAVIDYKSNYLGAHLADYHPDAMHQAMAEHHYYLQALIYAIAVARFLHARHALPESIAIRYLFLRGLNQNNHHGIWHWDIATADLADWLPPT
jgi:exodeoxyribonuclease V beta subunit